MSDDERNLEGRVVDGFQILERFAGGGFSEVHMAKHLRTNRFCAVTPGYSPEPSITSKAIPSKAM